MLDVHGLPPITAGIDYSRPSEHDVAYSHVEYLNVRLYAFETVMSSTPLSGIWGVRMVGC